MKEKLRCENQLFISIVPICVFVNVGRHVSNFCLGLSPQGFIHTVLHTLRGGVCRRRRIKGSLAQMEVSNIHRLVHVHMHSSLLTTIPTHIIIKTHWLESLMFLLSLAVVMVMG